jgi:translocation and assembly module TamB
MWRAAKWVGGILGGLVILLLLLLALANTPPGREALAGLMPRLTGGTVRVAGIAGRFPDALRIARVGLDDAQGAYATINDLTLDWSPLRLLRGRVVIDRLDAAQIAVQREPVSSGGKSTLPIIELREFRVARLDVAAALAGSPISVALSGSGAFVSNTDFNGMVDVHQTDGGGRYSLSGTASGDRLQAQVHVNEPAHGLLSGLVGLPDLGPIALDATLDGPRGAVGSRLTLAAGDLRATAGGTLDLENDAADLTVSAEAPAMRPRPDIGWQSVSVDARVRGPFARLDATGNLRVDALTAAGASIDSFTADIAGNAGRVRLNGTVTGLHLPGPNPGLLAAEPVAVEAEAQLDQPDRPVHLVVRHPLFTAEGKALTGEHRSLDASLQLAQLAPVAAMGHVDVQGGSTLNLHAAMQGDTTTLTADGTIGVTGGQPQVRALVGDDGRLSAAATVRGSDITVSRLQFTGRAGSFDASGSATDNRIEARWTLVLNDLAAAEPRLGGQLKVIGTIAGAMDDLSLAADLEGNVAAQGMSSGPLAVKVEANGLPSRPSGHITAQGSLLDAPIDLAVALHQAGDALAIDIERASWKSLSATGALQLPAATMVPVGDLRIAMTRLADVEPLVGRPIAGSVQATISATAGTSQPRMDARIDAEGVRAAGIGGTLHATASGTINALDVKLNASAPDLQGAAARLAAGAVVDAAGQTVNLASLQAEWRQQTLRLLAPARISFADEVTIDNLRLGLRQAVLLVSGRAGAALDLTASLRDLPADLFGADGTAKADARITGTPARPTGKVSLAATGLRLRNGLGRAMPAAAVTASADLTGADARIDARVTAGTSHLAVTGRAPLGAGGSMDLRGNGNLDLALLDPLLTAGGRQVRGRITLDATVTGTVAAPNVAGNARLTGGDVQDYTSGLHLSDITAQLEGAGGTLRIAQLSAKAGEGSITGSGTIGVLTAGMPVDLTITGRNARPLSSDLISAAIDAGLTVRGDALGQLAVGGMVRVRRADIRIPEKLPPDIAVLPINHPGAKPAASATPSVIALNISLEVPNQVFLRGRGVDVEFGGSMKIGGTTAAPRTIGGLELQRGSISLAGRSLSFTKGLISFNGGSITDPALDLVASSSTGNVTATLTIGGTAHDPKITLSSVPSLPQDEVLAHLLFGSDASRLGPLEIAEIAAGLATLTGAGGTGDPLDKVRQGLGLDRLGLTSGANGSTAVEAGRYVAPRVYAGVRQSASGASQAIVQYDITKGLKLQATAGTSTTSATGTDAQSSGSGIGLTYQFEY